MMNLKTVEDPDVSTKTQFILIIKSTLSEKILPAVRSEKRMCGIKVFVSGSQNENKGARAQQK